MSTTAAHLVSVIGGCWIAGGAQGHLRHAPQRFVHTADAPACPDIAGFGLERPARWGRFDLFARLGFTTVALALRDAPAAGSPPPLTGLVCASAGETLATDVAYYAAARDEGGALASPQLFSYTLPTAMIGECAIHFGLRGPTCNVGNRREGRGLEALGIACDCLLEGNATRMVCGWLEANADPLARGESGAPLPLGAAFVVLTANPHADAPLRLGCINGQIADSAGRPLEHLEGIFDRCAGH